MQSYLASVVAKNGNGNGNGNDNVIVNAVLCFPSQNVNDNDFLAIDKQIALKRISFDFDSQTRDVEKQLCTWKIKYLHNLQYDLIKAVLKLDIELFVKENNNNSVVKAMQQMDLNCTIWWQPINNSDNQAS